MFRTLINFITSESCAGDRGIFLQNLRDEILLRKLLSSSFPGWLSGEYLLNLESHLLHERRLVEGIKCKAREVERLLSRSGGYNRISIRPFKRLEVERKRKKKYWCFFYIQLKWLLCQSVVEQLKSELFSSVFRVWRGVLEHSGSNVGGGSECLSQCCSVVM